MKVTKKGIPVGNVEVKASVVNTITSVTEKESLHDDGNTPDVMAKDGIYSASIAPQTDGSYKIAITVQSTNAIKRVSSSESSLGSGRLLPIDQGPVAECFINCTMESVVGSFVQQLDVQNHVAFTQSTQYTVRFSP